MKVLAISGSPHQGGNSEAALEAVLAGARAQGAQADLVRLYALRIAPCKDCGGCRSGGGCVHHDDARELIEAMKGAAAVVFGTPIYNYYVSGIMKNLFDRTFSTYHQQGLAGRRVAAILVQHSSGADEAVSLFRHFCEDQGCILVDTVTIDTLNRRGVVAGDPALLRRLESLGARLLPPALEGRA
jgi:multimeric flavodoxin WrbA